MAKCDLVGGNLPHFAIQILSLLKILIRGGKIVFVDKDLAKLEQK